MTKPITLHDYELISAYLDDACSPKERVVLLQRFDHEPELAQALLEFKHTRRLMQSLPLKRAPRNFTLSASQVPAHPQRFFWVPTLNYVAMGATLMLVVAFVGANLFPGLMGTALAPRAQNVMTASDSANSAPMIITWGQGNSAAKSGMGGGGAPSTFSSINPSVGAEGPTATSTEAPLTMMAQAPATNSAEEAVNPILGIAPTAEQGKVISPQAANTRNAIFSFFTLKLVEIILAAIAVISALAALVIKKLR